ncbi:MAG: type II toxin-antitoxin system VapC family toxin [Acidobacteriaceae bacterium]
MTYYFLESSAFAKLFILEQGSDPLILLLDSVDDSHKLVSTLASLEIRSAIRRRERAGEIRRPLASQALAALEAEGTRIVEQPLSQAVVDAAKLVLDSHALRALDALHLGACIIIRNTLQVPDICFVSADDALLQAAEAERFPILNPLKM